MLQARALSPLPTWQSWRTVSKTDLVFIRGEPSGNNLAHANSRSSDKIDQGRIAMFRGSRQQRDDMVPEPLSGRHKAVVVLVVWT